MTDYVIGDIHGCYEQLTQLLAQVEFSAEQDHLYCVGDLVNRGPQSADVLRYLMQLPQVTVVLGNHDLHLIACYYGIVKQESDHPLQRLINEPDIKQMIEWLCQQPILFVDNDKKFAMVHAGLPPQWSFTEACHYASEVEQILRSTDREAFLHHMYGDEPSDWTMQLTGWDRLRYIVNALTRMRFCSQQGVLNLSNKSNREQRPGFRPWFDWYDSSMLLCFGHWASLNGASTHSKCIALDTGCVWRNKLTLMRLSDQELFRVPGISVQA